MVRALRLRALRRRARSHLGNARRAGITDTKAERRHRAKSLVLRPTQACHRRYQIDRSKISRARALHDPLGGGDPAQRIQGAAPLVRQGRDAGLPLSAILRGEELPMLKNIINVVAAAAAALS